MEKVSSCDTFQQKNGQQQKYSKIPVKLAGKIPWNKFCLYLIAPTKHEGR